MIFLVPVFAALLAMSAPADTLSDDALVAYASKPFDKANASGGVLGIHHGAKVIVDIRCSDICPAYTTRIIHYDVAPGPGCEKIDGVARSQAVPISIASVVQTFCVPRILSDRKLY